MKQLQKIGGFAACRLEYLLSCHQPGSFHNFTSAIPGHSLDSQYSYPGKTWFRKKE